MNYKNQTDKIREIPMPRGYQCLIHTCYSKLSRRPTSILWTNGTNLIHFRVPDQDETIQDSFLTKNEIFKFAKKVDLPNEKAYQMQEHPINIGITDFHYYLLFQESITILSTITQKIVLTEEFKGALVSDMTYEKKTGIFWIFSNKGITKLDTSKEST